jgi:hypothetical protein
VEASGSTEMEAAVSRLESSVTDMQGRVNGDLAVLRSELDALNAQHDEIDLTPFVARIDAIIETVSSIDVTVVGGPADPAPVGDVPGQPPVESDPTAEDSTLPAQEIPAEETQSGDEEGTVGGDPTPEGASPGIAEGAQQPPAPDEEWPEGQGGTEEG